MIVKKSKVKNKKSMRYEAEWLLECLMLRIKSPEAYRHIDDSGILPLPSYETLRRLIAGLACHFGFQKMALEAIQRAFANKTKNETEGVVCFDEMVIMEEMSFDGKDHCFKGFAEQVENDDETDEIIMEEINKAGLSEEDQIKLGLLKRKPTESNKANEFAACNTEMDDDDLLEMVDDEEEDEISNDSCTVNDANAEPKKIEVQEEQPTLPQDTPLLKEDTLKKDASKNLADHALVFMFRPLHEEYNWVQPFGVFAASKALPGEKIFSLLMKAVILLEHSGATVSAVVCDGAQTNKTVWKHCGIGVDKDEVTNSMNHPTNPTKKVRFLLDPPHAFKCIRNQMCNKKNLYVQVTYYCVYIY